MKKIIVVTGSRAEWGLLEPLVRELDKEFYTLLAVTGSHLSPQHGYTVQHIDHPLKFKIDILLNNDSPMAISKSMGLAMISFGELYERLRPSLMVVLGDRFEIFSAVSAAYMARIPVCHIHGGETTAGSLDEGLRHSITHMSSLHFVATGKHQEIVANMLGTPSNTFHFPNKGGLNFKGVYSYGALGCEGLKKRKYEYVTPEHGKIMVVWHPTTARDDDFGQLLYVLRERPEYKSFSLPNADVGNGLVREAILRFVEHDTRSGYFISKERPAFIESLLECNAIVGNSSASVIEAPALGVPTILVGDRQKGRPLADSILPAKPEVKSIRKAFAGVYSAAFQELISGDYRVYYKGGKVAEKMVKKIKEYLK